MNLTYVNNNGTLDHAARSSIRRQAAKGHNLGRKINRPSRVNTFQRRAAQKSLSSVGSNNAAPKANSDNRLDGSTDLGNFIAQIEPVIGDGISILNVPITISQEDRTLMFEAVAFMSSPRFEPSLEKALDHGNANRSLFMQLIFRDQAYYHCALAITAECTHSLSRARSTSARHIIQSCQLVNQRISGAGQISNATLAVVVALSSYECTRGRYDNGRNHLSGLMRMVEMRGGLERIGSEEPQLTHKIYRADLDYALRSASPPKLKIDLLEKETSLQVLDLRDVNGGRVYSNAISQDIRKNLGAELSWLWDSADNLSILINEASTGTRDKLRSEHFLKCHIWLGHRLVNYAPLNPSRSLNRIQNIAHLGLVAMVCSFLCGLDRQIKENPHLAQLVAEELTRDPIDVGAEELCLWLLFIAGVVVLQDSAHHGWLFPKARTLIQTLQLHNWDDTLKVLIKFPWINCYYETKAVEFFNKIYSH